MTRFTVHVTDHAVLRFMERALNVKIDDIRTYIAREVAEAADVGAANVVIEGMRYCFTRHQDEVHVTTVLGEGMIMLGHRKGHDQPEKKSSPDQRRRDNYEAMKRRLKQQNRRAKKS